MDAVARVAIPLLEYAPITQNSSESQVFRTFVSAPTRDPGLTPWKSQTIATISTPSWRAAYRQIFFHAFKTDRDVNLESQLKDGQITVRDFIRGLVLSDTFKRTFYGFNSNYKVVRHLCERILGRKVNGKG